MNLCVIGAVEPRAIQIPRRETERICREALQEHDWNMPLVGFAQSDDRISEG